MMYRNRIPEHIDEMKVAQNKNIERKMPMTEISPPFHIIEIYPVRSKIRKKRKKAQQQQQENKTFL